MAKRIKPKLGFVPEGFINRLKREYPEGVPSNLLDDFVKEALGKQEAKPETVIAFRSA
jgi:hypothetical protein